MKPGKKVKQAAAIALWHGRVCLVTSRSGKRWVVPKGCLEPGLTPEEIVLQEAWEEAGLVGEVSDAPVGVYCYHKAGKLHEVQVFVLEVKVVVADWPESHRRQRRWLRPEKAAAQVREDGLRGLLQAFVVRQPLAA